MMGSDMPFPIGDHEPQRIIRQAAFSASEQAAMAGGVARRLFGL
jgi:aminocarboxymuconate-semialdehyde decarboxylase